MGRGVAIYASATRWTPDRPNGFTARPSANNHWAKRRRAIVASLGYSLDPRNAKFHKALGKQLGQGAARWQEIEALEDGLELHRQDAEWLVRLAKAYFEMERFAEAAKLYETALPLRPADATLLFATGLAHAGQSGPAAARPWFASAVEADRKLNATRYGHGVFFEALKDWRSAADAYFEQLKRRPLDAESITATDLHATGPTCGPTLSRHIKRLSP